MHVITFYSFKGGVGRTAAVVNVAVELAKAGRRVLMVDFDLEAPGLHTYDLPWGKLPEEHRNRFVQKSAPMSRAGIVEYIWRYLDTRTAPRVDDYVHECPRVGANDGRLWIMPAGRQDGRYEQQFANLDWQDLYETRQGYLLFENLKAQWQSFVDPHYVLIDSRTGYGDIAGICTRQLPDAVAVVLMPTDQHLLGLEKIISHIRAEADGPRHKKINLHFVMGNMPSSLDDENRVVDSRIARFKDSLQTDEPIAIIPNYPSIDHLNQMVFSLKKPNSKLAEQYRNLASYLRRANPEDPLGALDLLAEARRELLFPASKKAIGHESHLENIQRFHHDNPQVLFALGTVRRLQGMLDDARYLFDQAALAGNTDAELWVAQVECNALLDDGQAVMAAVRRLLDTTTATSYQISRAVRIALPFEPEVLDGLPNAKAVESLGVDERIWLAQKLDESRSSLPPAIAILEQVLHFPNINETQRRIASQIIAVNLIGVGQFDRAAQIIEGSGILHSNLDIPNSFNLAIAKWGFVGEPTQGYFLDFLALVDSAREMPAGPNFEQCLAVAYWVVGRLSEASAHLAAAHSALLASPKPTFSCWQYLTVRPAAFLDDLAEIRLMLDGRQVSPPIRRSIVADENESLR